MIYININLIITSTTNARRVVVEGAGWLKTQPLSDTDVIRLHVNYAIQYLYKLYIILYDLSSISSAISWYDIQADGYRIC